MRYLKILLSLCIIFSMNMLAPLDASTIRQFNLGEMTNNADKIFRGTVTQIETGTITAGGGTLPTVTYTLRVNDTLKGDTSSDNDKLGNVVKVTMLGSIKGAPAKDGIRFVGGFKAPALERGKEYLLFTTTPSALGLSMTVGVGQGLFRFVFDNQVINDAKNVGLFRDMESSDMPKRGAIPYSLLSQRIRSMANATGGTE